MTWQMVSVFAATAASDSDPLGGETCDAHVARRLQSGSQQSRERPNRVGTLFSKVFRLVSFGGTLVSFVELGALFQMSIGTPTSFSKGTRLHVTR